MLTLASRVSEGDRFSLLDDWQHALDQITMGLTLKLAYWQQLPWLLCGLGHADTNLARELGRTCLSKYDGLTAGQREHAHHITKRFCDASFGRFDDGPPLRTQLEAFVNGIDFGVEDG